MTALSGGTTLGQARIKDVSIVKGKKTTYDADCVNRWWSSAPCCRRDGIGNKTAPVQVLDPLTRWTWRRSRDADEPDRDDRGGSTWDGRFLVVAKATRSPRSTPAAARRGGHDHARVRAVARRGGAARSGDRRARSGRAASTARSPSSVTSRASSARRAASIRSGAHAGQRSRAPRPSRPTAASSTCSPAA